MVKSITLRPRKSCDFLGQPLPTISRSPTAGLLGIGLDCDVTAMSGSQHAVLISFGVELLACFGFLVLSQQQKTTTRYSRYHFFVLSRKKQPCALGQPL